MQKKPVKIWIVMIVLPFVILVVNALVQVGIQFAVRPSESSQCEQTNDSLSDELGRIEENRVCTPKRSSIKLVVNIVSLMTGVLAVIGILGLPIWITMLVLAINHNNRLQQIHGPPGPQPPMPPVAG